MTEQVAVLDGDESSDAASEAAPATQPDDEMTTLKKRLSGKDQALTRLKAEAETSKAELTALQKKVAEYENASLTEVERLQKKLADAEARAQEAETKATRAELAKKYPLTFDLLGDRTPVDDESWLAERETRLSKESEDESESEPSVLPNNPRRTPAPGTRPKGEKSADELRADLAAMGNPFQDAGW